MRGLSEVNRTPVLGPTRSGPGLTRTRGHRLRCLDARTKVLKLPIYGFPAFCASPTRAPRSTFPNA
jgi:hypothetical protein